MKQIYFGDNLEILRELPSELVDLIYIDPPFNTGKTQKLKTIKTVRTEDGDRKGFQGNRYKSIEVGTKSYKDSFNGSVDLAKKREEAYEILAPESSVFFIEHFLRPRLEEAYRILKPHGSLYFHIDYREVHYCKLLLDSIFGRDSFINEIIWAYDFGGRSRSRWPAKHDNILFYAKDPDKYIWNTNEADRIPYMAPGLVGPEKAKKKKLPTDTWWYEYVGKRQTDTWWHTIVGTNSKERLGYPTQKPLGVINRIIKSSSMPGHIVLDFFAGSGTVGESCLKLKRDFILIDNNPEALEVMAYRFDGFKEVEWINFDPSPYQQGERRYEPLEDVDESGAEKIEFSKDFEMLAATASYYRDTLQKQNDLWKNSPFEWILQLAARQKSKLGKQLMASWCAGKGLSVHTDNDISGVGLVIEDKKVAIKFSTLWKSGRYAFQQIRIEGYDLLLCFGISPHAAHCWVFKREYILKHAHEQHKVGKDAEYWIKFNPLNPPDWAKGYGGSLDQAYSVLTKLLKEN